MIKKVIQLFFTQSQKYFFRGGFFGEGDTWFIKNSFIHFFTEAISRNKGGGDSFKVGNHYLQKILLDVYKISIYRVLCFILYFV